MNADALVEIATTHAGLTTTKEGFQLPSTFKCAAPPRRPKPQLTKIRVKLGQAEAEVEADQEHLREAIDLVPELAAKLPVAANHESEGLRARLVDQTTAVRDVSTPTEMPVVALEKGDSLADVIGKFFADPWGRERRKLSDVREALRGYGLNYPKQSVAVALLRLAKTTRIRRFKAEDGEFVYTSSAMLMAPVSQARQEETLGDLASPQPN
ncbi:MAG: hypothetical protein ACHQYR_01100 [Candidatus Gagatemarchaeaceae archaeon]